MPERPQPTSLNGKPTDSHDRNCHNTPEDAKDHIEHSDSICATCGCCWGCDTGCCVEYDCPNTDCGCCWENNDAMQAMQRRVP